MIALLYSPSFSLSLSKVNKNFFPIKKYIKDKLIDQMENYIQLARKLACMLKTYNPMVGFSKYEFNNKLLGNVTFFRVTARVT